MNSLIVKHPSEEALNNSIVGQRLDKELIKCLNDNLKVYTNSARALASLLKINKLSNEVIMTLLRPWYRANMLATWCNKVSWSDEKARAKILTKTIKNLKKQLNYDPKNIITLMLFMTSSEPDIKTFLSNLGSVDISHRQP